MNRIDLDGQHAIVTGGAQGLGFAMAKRFVASGATVTLWDMDAERLDAAKADLGEAAKAIVVDIVDWDAVAAAHASTEAAGGPGLNPDQLRRDRRARPGAGHLRTPMWRQIIDINLPARSWSTAPSCPE